MVSLPSPPNISPSTTSGRDPTLSTDVDDPSHPLHHHRRVVTDFDYGDILGEGSYSTVLVGRDKRTGKHYAVKRLDKAHIVKNNKVKYVMIERDALSRMNHPGIVKLYWTFKDNRSLYFVLDLAKSGELYTFIRRLSPFDLETTRFYAAEILSAIGHIHSKGVIHRDIKPENILLDDNFHIKITDFGSAKILSEKEDNVEEEVTSARSFVGTAEYVSPELLRSDPVSKEADYWAFGCVIYQMLSGKSPFKAATDYLIFQKIKNLDYVVPDDFSEPSKDIVQRLLTSEPETRLGSTGIDAIKDHPFFDGVDWDHLFQATPPNLKEKLEMEARLHPVTPPKFDLDNSEEEEEDMWFGTNKRTHPAIEAIEQNNPFQDYNPPIEYVVNPLTSSSSSPPPPPLPSSSSPPLSQPSAEAATSQSIPITSLSKPKQLQDQRKRASQLSSTPSSPTQSIPDRLGGQAHPPWVPHLYPNESVIKSGRVTRKRGLISKKRNLILTNRPRLLYLDEGSDRHALDGNLRCEIPWTSHLLPELKGRSIFCLHTVKYSLCDLTLLFLTFYSFKA
ncbi:kinase-like domain-containing protein [Blakeslea trispora]|nr:kinase-like domain-containing protein [Blakeslea trispora]